jgi:hypothetical protein
MNKYIVSFFVILFTCNFLLAQEENETSKMISSGESMAMATYLTSDNLGNPVLSWVEGEKGSEHLFYAVFNQKKGSFNQVIKILPSKGLSPHHESMPKVAFKGDGTVVALYSKKKPTPENRFAGAIYYVESSDKGANWTSPKYLHNGDTTAGIGRSFFDIASLPDGEVGAIWLDGRNKLENGSSLFFAKTTSKKGFAKDIEIGKNTCQCCRTDIYLQSDKSINIAYRNIFNDSIRDMAHIRSEDLGKTFSKPKRISADDWIIYGCPHTGPTMTEMNDKLHFFWFTMGGDEGIYHTAKDNQTKRFAKRDLFSPHARHPQTTTLSDGTLALVWDENFKTEKSYTNRIGLFLQKSGKEEKKYITSNQVSADHPVIMGLENDKILVAWVQKEKGQSQVYYKVISR